MRVTSCAQIFFKILHSPAFEEPHIEELSTICVILHVNVLLITVLKGSDSLV